MLSQMPGYEAVQSWFVQAVPALSNYITLDPSHAVVSRLRVTDPSNSLAVHNDGTAAFYLGHGSDNLLTPRMLPVDTTSVTAFWQRPGKLVLAKLEGKYLFQPQTYRAPVIRGFANFDVGGAQFGSKYTPEFAQTAWNIVAPFSDDLVIGSRVILQTCPFSNGQAEVGGTSKVDPVSHMVVFRNAQGVFLPAMSDRDEYQYWRIVSARGAALGSHIKTGDEVRLCWAFKDQMTGFRDYKDDVFGRRQNQCPSDLENQVLYLKIPWPRFEKENVPNAMVMSTDSTTDNAMVKMNTAQDPHDQQFLLQDLKFRIDLVANSGKGDADDYMLRNVEQKGNFTTQTLRPFGNPLQMLFAIQRFGL